MYMYILVTGRVSGLWKTVTAFRIPPLANLRYHLHVDGWFPGDSGLADSPWFPSSTSFESEYFGGK